MLRFWGLFYEVITNDQQSESLQRTGFWKRSDLSGISRVVEKTLNGSDCEGGGEGSMHIFWKKHLTFTVYNRYSR